MTDAGISIFGIVFLFIAIAAFSPYVFGLYAIVSIIRTPEPYFGPPWDNTRNAWLVGVAVSFLIPFGSLVTAITWISGGKKGLRTYGVAGRPFWLGRPNPGPPWGYGPQA